MKTKSSLMTSLHPVVLIVAMALSLSTVVGAQETVAEVGSHYVIKVTSTLAYVDVGQAAGATIGGEYLILRPDEYDEEMMVVVGEVRILRVFAGFAIAEITSVEPDEEIAVLNRVYPRIEAMAMDGVQMMAQDESPSTRPAKRVGTLGRSFVLLGGMDLSKDIDLTWGPANLNAVDDVSGPSVAFRLGRAFTEKLRLALTYRLSGDPLGPDEAEVTQLSIELDAHIIFRGIGKPGPYLGLGGGLHQLTWDVANDAIDDSTYKTGFNLYGGIEIPVADGRWSLFAEGGYQGVTKWAGMLDASHVRAYAGLGLNF